MKTQVNRFRLRGSDGTEEGKYQSLEEIYNVIKDNDMAQLGYWKIEDLEDDIWIHSDELINTGMKEKDQVTCKCSR